MVAGAIFETVYLVVGALGIGYLIERFGGGEMLVLGYVAIVAIIGFYILCGCDITRAISSALAEMSASERARCLFAIPVVVFNDDGFTLDGFTVQDLENATGARIAVVSCNASDFLEELTCCLTAQE